MCVSVWPFVCVSSISHSTTGIAPVRWTAPEGLTESKFSAEGDVWSFGILCVEIYMDGATPYPGNPNIMAFVTGGGIHPQPPSCPNHVYQDLRRCWAFEPHQRPTFDHMNDVFVLLGLANDASHGRLDADELSNTMATVIRHHSQSEATRMERDFMSLQARPAVGGILPGPTLLDGATDYADLDAAYQDDHAMALARMIADQKTSKDTAEHTQHAHPSAVLAHDSALAAHHIDTGRAAPLQASPEAAVDGILPTHTHGMYPQHTRPPGTTHTTCTNPGTREPSNDAADYYAIPDSHVTHETPYGAVGRIDSSEQKLGRGVIRSTETSCPIRGGHSGSHAGSDAVVATPPHPYGTPQLAGNSNTVVDSSGVPYAATHASPERLSLVGRGGHAGALVAPGSSDVALASDHDRPPIRNDTRSSLVNVQEGMYAIKPSRYEPVGKAQPTHRCEAKIFTRNWDRV